MALVSSTAFVFLLALFTVFLQTSTGTTTTTGSFDELIGGYTPIQVADSVSHGLPPCYPLKIGDYIPVNVDDKVRELAQFAVDEHKLTSGDDELRYLEVEKAERQWICSPYTAYNYRLVIHTARGGLTFNYEAIVYAPSALGSKRELTSFKLLHYGADTVSGLDMNMGGYAPIANVKNNNDHVQELGRLAVEEYNSRFNIDGHLSFVEVKEAKKQIGAGTNYYM